VKHNIFVAFYRYRYTNNNKWRDGILTTNAQKLISNDWYELFIRTVTVFDSIND